MKKILPCFLFTKMKLRWPNPDILDKPFWTSPNWSCISSTMILSWKITLDQNYFLQIQTCIKLVQGYFLNINVFLFFSFCYSIPTERDLYKDIRGNTEWFDFSNYPEDHPNYDTSNHLVPGKFKDEMGGAFIKEFCGLRSKMYSILKDDGKEKKTAKGVLKQVKNDVIKHEDYKNTLIDNGVLFHKGTKIFQKEHELFTVDFSKKTLSPYNDKNWITIDTEDDFTTYSYGHYKIDEYELVKALCDVAVER